MSFTRIVMCCAVSALLFCAGLGAAEAQQAGQAPAEQPPAGFAGTEYVDSAGCVYVRAGIGEMVKWVPRVTADRRQVCGYEPTYSVRRAKQPVIAAAPPPVSASQAPAPAPAMALAAPAKSALKPKVVAPPKLTRKSLAGVVVTPENAASKGVSMQDRILPRHVYEERKALRPVKRPKNYIPAWKDGRLNPRRAEQTLEGHAQMQQVWTNTVPRRLVD